MFEKKCKQCNRKISRDFDFCPYCGINLGKVRDKRDYGFLGKDDFLGAENMSLGMPLDGLMNNLMKQLSSQMNNLDKQPAKNKIKSNAISISISTCPGKQPEIKVAGLGPEFEQLKGELNQKPMEIKNMVSDSKARSSQKFPRIQAKTNVRRFSNKVVYEIDMPEVSSFNDILINKLENSLEIKAFGSSKVYVKTLPLNLPLLNYKFEQGKLILEFKAK